jgi:hypothetical protein
MAICAGAAGAVICAEFNNFAGKAMSSRNKPMFLRQDVEQSTALRHLPKNVRLVGAARAQEGNGLYEFEVVMGNAAYREGEHFYLTPAKAQCAYAMAAGM